jgi:RNA recognition motif-containing protein
VPSGILTSEESERGITEDCPLVSKQRIVVEEDSMDSIAASELRIEGDSTMAEIFLTNLPHDCSDRELREWVESRGIEVRSTRIILDLESGVAPAFGYVEIQNADLVKAGAASLNGWKLRSNTVMAKPVQIVPRDFNRAVASL